MKKRYKGFLKVIVITFLIFTVLIGGFLIFISNYYHADEALIGEFVDDSVSKTVLYDGAILYEKETSEVGFIFYPGGKVEFTSYEPLMYELASKGISCILIEMPFNLAFFDMNAASKVMDMLPNIKNWYIGGHSLGGSIAATYLENNINEFYGLVLLGSYSMSDFSSSNIKVLSIYGSEDKVLNKSNYDKYKSNLPVNTVEYIIEGGCHSYFGVYGHQQGDGIPSISVEEQIILTADLIIEYINNSA